MLNLSIKNLDRLCLVTVFFVVVLSGSLVAKDNIKRKKQVQQEKELLTNRLKDLKTVEQKAKRLEGILNRSKKELEALNKRVPGTADIGMFFNQLDTLMKERDLELISVQPQPGIKEESITRIPIRLMFKGSFVNIFKMIHALETMDRTVVMERVAIVKSNSNGECQTDLLTSIFKK
jgi:Tfp pilus assembly protein PilO